MLRFCLERPEAEEYFKSAQKMAADSSVPADLPSRRASGRCEPVETMSKGMRELGRVLQRVMIGDRNVDLSSLPRAVGGDNTKDEG